MGLATTCLVLLAAAAGEESWPSLLGPSRDGRVRANAFSDSVPGLELAWVVDIGSAYSGVVAGNGFAVTMLTRDDRDELVAFDSETGAVKWRLPVGPAYPEQDGAWGGPRGTPVIGSGMVYALGPYGHFLAADLQTGELRWSKHLVEDFEASMPDYGFTTTPLVAGETVIVQVGGPEGNSLVAWNGETGDLAWNQGQEPVEYQSPTLLSLKGRSTVLSFAGKRMTGHDAASGELIFEQELGERDRAGSAVPVPMGERRFFASISGAITAFEINEVDGALHAETLFQSRDLGNSYGLPVHHDGHLYGFRRGILTCIDADTGERRWKSRPPGGSGLILVDDRLVIFGAEGNVVVAAASPEGYQEQARLQGLAGSSLTWPSFADGKVFIRNAEQLAAVKILRSGEAPEAGLAQSEPMTSPGNHEFGAFLRRVAGEADKNAAVEEFLASQESFPLVEGNWVHFVYQGEVEDIALTGTMIDQSQGDPMHRLAGTNLYYRSYQLDQESRWEYRFVVNYDQRIVDPRNDRHAPADWGNPFSVVSMPGYQRPQHLGEPSGVRGKIDSYSFVSETLGNSRDVRVYLPPGYEDGDRAYPLLLVFDGLNWLEKGLLANTLDNLIGDSVEPLVVACIGRIGEYWLEAGGSETEAYIDMIADEFLQDLHGRYRLIPEAESRALMGVKGFAVPAGLAALKYPDRFRGAALQSISIRDGGHVPFLRLLDQEPESSLLFYLDWNRYEARNVDRGYDYGEDARHVATALENAGLNFVGGEAADSHGWGSWRARSSKILETFFPTPSSKSE